MFSLLKQGSLRCFSVAIHDSGQRHSDLVDVCLQSSPSNHPPQGLHGFRQLRPQTQHRLQGMGSGSSRFMLKLVHPRTDRPTGQRLKAAGPAWGSRRRPTWQRRPPLRSSPRCPAGRRKPIALILGAELVVTHLASLSFYFSWASFAPSS